MLAVIYMSKTGDIMQTIEGGLEAIEATAEAMQLDFLEIPEKIDNVDQTHRVVKNELVEKPSA